MGHDVDECPFHRGNVDATHKVTMCLRCIAQYDIFAKHRLSLWKYMEYAEDCDLEQLEDTRVCRCCIHSENLVTLAICDDCYETDNKHFVELTLTEKIPIELLDEDNLGASIKLFILENIDKIVQNIVGNIEWSI